MIFFQDTTLRTVSGSLNSTGMERTRLLPAYGLADNAANAANGHVLARRVLLVIAATLALAATTAGTAAGLREVGPRDALASASAATTASQLVAWNEYSTFEEGKPVPYTIKWCVHPRERARPAARSASSPARAPRHARAPLLRAGTATCATCS